MFHVFNLQVPIEEITIPVHEVILREKDHNL